MKTFLQFLVVGVLATLIVAGALLNILTLFNLGCLGLGLLLYTLN